MSQDRTAVTKTFRWDLVIPHEGPKPSRPTENAGRETFSKQAEVASTKERNFENVSATVLEGIVRWSGK